MIQSIHLSILFERYAVEYFSCHSRSNLCDFKVYDDSMVPRVAIACVMIWFAYTAIKRLLAHYSEKIEVMLIVEN